MASYSPLLTLSLVFDMTMKSYLNSINKQTLNFLKISVNKCVQLFLYVKHHTINSSPYSENTLSTTIFRGKARHSIASQRIHNTFFQRKIHEITPIICHKNYLSSRCNDVLDCK